MFVIANTKSLDVCCVISNSIKNIQNTQILGSLSSGFSKLFNSITYSLHFHFTNYVCQIGKTARSRHFTVEPTHSLHTVRTHRPHRIASTQQFFPQLVRLLFLPHAHISVYVCVCASVLASGSGYLRSGKNTICHSVGQFAQSYLNLDSANFQTVLTLSLWLALSNRKRNPRRR